MTAHPLSTLTEGPIAQKITLMTLPMMAGIYAMIAIFLADTYFVAKLGTEALAAISFTFPLTMLLIHFVMGIGIGAASVIARALGQNEGDKVKRIATDALLLTFLLIALITPVGILTIDPLFRFLGASTEVLALIRQYMNIWYIGIACLIVPMVGGNILRAAGDAWWPGVLMVGAALINLILDPILIFGYFGLPAWGIRGAAIATLIAFFLSLIATLGIIMFRYRLISFDKPSRQSILSSWREILHIGVPAALTNCILYLAFAVIIKFVAPYGKEAVAGFGIATRIEILAMAAYFAMASVLGPFVGQNWGAQKFGRVQEGLDFCHRFCLIWGIFLAVTLAFIATPLVKLFDQDNYVLAVATLYLLIVPISYASEGFMMMSTSTFNALGRPIPSTLIALSRMFLIYVPLAYIGKEMFGLIGIFAAAFLANWIMGMVSMRWNHHYRRRASLAFVQPNP